MSSPQPVVATEYAWLDDGVPETIGRASKESDEPRRIMHERVQVTFYRSTDESSKEADASKHIISVGDSVVLYYEEDDKDHGNDEAEADQQQGFPCRIEKLWQEAAAEDDEDQSPQAIFSARWFYSLKEAELMAEGASLCTIQEENGQDRKITNSRLLKQLDHCSRQSRHPVLLLSNISDENAVSSIQKIVNVEYQKGSTKLERGGSNVAAASRATGDTTIATYSCQYELDLVTGQMAASEVHLRPFSGEVTASAGSDKNEKKRARRSEEEEEEDDESSSTDVFAEDMLEDNVNMGDEGVGGSHRRASHGGGAGDDDSSGSGGDIEIGDEFQAIVEPWTGPQPPPASRQPKLMYRPNAISDVDLVSFLKRLAELHTPYLVQTGLMSPEEEQDPYTPILSTVEAERVMKQQHEEEQKQSSSVSTRGQKQRKNRKPGLLTGSSMSTAASLGNSAMSEDEQRLALLKKECDADAVLELLADHNYDTEAALKSAKQNLATLSCGWTRVEKELYDQGVREHNFSLKDIAKSIATKTHQQVVDYHFRFKMTDQFRKYQNKKHSQSMRVMDVVEKRRSHDRASGISTVRSTQPPLAVAVVDENAGVESRSDAMDVDDEGEKEVLGSSNKRQRKQHWSEMSAANSANAVREREGGAKQLLLDIYNTMGREVMEDVAAVIRELHRSFDAETKDALFTLLEDQPQLQQRLLEYLPRRF